MSAGGFCDKCGGARVYRTGTTKSGPYEGQTWRAWMCPKGKNNCTGKPVFLKDGEPDPGQTEPQASQAAPRVVQTATPAIDSRERSIAAQACCKAACEAAAAMTGNSEAAAVISEHWIVNLAQRLLNEVVLPAAEGKPVGPVTPQAYDPDKDLAF